MARQREIRDQMGCPLPVRLFVAALFAVSGGAALVDQVVWTRWLNLALGSSAYATVVVLACFMGGLGVGSFAAGRIADRYPRRALLAFAVAEAGIGIWSLLSIPILGRWLPRWAATLAQTGEMELPLAVRALLAATTLALPTMLMGATMPLLARWAVSSGGLAGRDVGLLYTLNTLGGALGALLAAFWLIETLGLSRSVAAAGAADLLVAAAALAYLRASSRDRRTGKERFDDVRRREPDAAGLAAPLLAACAGFLVSGAVGLALEVVAARIIAVLAGSSAYGFAAMLAAFLVGIALGSLAGSRLAERGAAPGLGLGLGLAGLALGVGFARRIFEGEAFDAVGGVLGLGWTWGPLVAGCLVALLPASISLGFVVPFVARLAAAVPDRTARRFGLAYALNTFGAVLGAVLAGVLLIPWLGTARTLLGLTLLPGATALLVVVTAVPKPRRRWGLVVASAFIASGLLLGWGADPVRNRLLGHFRGQQILDYREGPVQTIAVVRERNLQQLSFLRLVTNQTSLTGTHLYAKRYMRLLGHLPAFYARRCERALVICLGTGMTAAAVATHPDLERLDVAEISPEVIHVAPHFAGVSQGVLEDPRTRLHVDDGRHVLLASTERWDLVTLEPPPPRDSGVVSLYTREFYELARRRLTPGGVLAQWIPLHSQSGDEIRMLIASFVEAFPHALGFLPLERELVLLGADEPLLLDAERFARSLEASPELASSLAEIGIDSAEALVAPALLDRERLRSIAGSAPLVTDDRPRVEYFGRFGRSPPLPGVASWIDDPLPLEQLVPGGDVALSRASFRSEREALLLLLRGAWLAEQGAGSQATSLLLEAHRRRPSSPYLRWAAGISDAHLDALRARAEARPGVAAHWREYALRLAQRSRYADADAAYARALDANPRDVETLLQYGDLLMGPLERPSDGRRLLESLLRIAPRHPAADVIRRRLGVP